MESIKHILDFFLHIDKHLLDVVQTYGVWAYGILFAVIFMETGLVVTSPFPVSHGVNSNGRGSDELA